MEAKPRAAGRRLGTFAGVFRPVFLTILGALIYLREGWLVGNSGLLGALAVIVAANLITGATSLAVSSIATNVRIRPGGAFAIIAGSLGLEAGGAIGIPLYVAQTASAAMYLYAFSEAFRYLVPGAPTGRVVLAAWAALSVLSWTSAKLSFRTQGVMLLVVTAALLSAALGPFRHDFVRPQLVGTFPEADLAEAFAIFFPAVTGIMVGVGMSGDLADPRRNIPRGTLAAWGLTFAIYVGAAFWYAGAAPPDELVRNKLVMVERAFWGPAILFGLVSSTLMAALSSLVAAPRLLQAMAAEGVTPAARLLARTSEAGEPRTASLFTIGLAGLFLLAGSLDAVAPLVTSFFLVTFLAVNLVVLLEQFFGMISFRPTFRIGRTVPFLGAAGSLVTLFLSGPSLALVDVAVVGGIYAWLHRRGLRTPWETVTSGLPVTIAAWAARRATAAERAHRAWRPDLLLPAESVERVDALLPLAEAIVRYNGSIKLLGTRGDLAGPLADRAAELRGRGVEARRAVEDTCAWAEGTITALDVLQGALFPPNLLLVAGDRPAEELQRLLDHCRAVRVGFALLLGPAPAAAPESVLAWLSDRSPDWPLRLRMTNLDLPVLLGYLLTRDRGRLGLVSVVEDPAERGAGRRWLAGLVDQGRLPDGTLTAVEAPPFLEAVARRRADLHLFGLGDRLDLDRLRAIQRAAGAPCLFLKDSGRESLLA